MSLAPLHQGVWHSASPFPSPFQTPQQVLLGRTGCSLSPQVAQPGHHLQSLPSCCRQGMGLRETVCSSLQVPSRAAAGPAAPISLGMGIHFRASITNWTSDEPGRWRIKQVSSSCPLHGCLWPPCVSLWGWGVHVTLVMLLVQQSLK